MFTAAERETIRASLIEAARTDDRITGGAMTGSASVGKEDEYSDIDLAFGVRKGKGIEPTLQDFTDRMYRNHDAIHHTDIHAGSWVYRVFLLKNTLQVDIAFAPEQDFGAKGPSFRLLFGKSVEVPQPSPPLAEAQIGMAWLYALHVRSCIARNKPLQAEYMISAMRDQALSMACLRHKLTQIAHGRSFDMLPEDVTAPLTNALVTSLDTAELNRAFRVLISALLVEIRSVDTALASRLEPTLRELADSPSAML